MLHQRGVLLEVMMSYTSCTYCGSRLHTRANCPKTWAAHRVVPICAAAIVGSPGITRMPVHIMRAVVGGAA